MLVAALALIAVLSVAAVGSAGVAGDITASSQTITYRQTATTPTCTDEGPTFGDSGDTLAVTGKVYLGATEITDLSTLRAGTYVTRCDGTAVDADASVAPNFVPGSLTVDPATLTATLIADDKTFDGSTTAAATCSVTADTDLSAGDDVACSVTSASFDRATAGSRTVTASVTLTGADAGNYVLASTSVQDGASIDPATLTATLTANDKTYDRSTTAAATCSVAADTDLSAGDDVACSVTSASFDSVSAGSGKTVTASVTLTGTDAGNYELAGAGASVTSTSLTDGADILTTTVTATLAADDKTYDGTAGTTGTCSLTGVIAPDDVSCRIDAADFTSATAGTSKTVDATVSLTGGDAANYALDDDTISDTADILTKTVSATLTADDKTYDGSAGTTGTCSLTGVVSPDDATCRVDDADFTSATAGTSKTVDATVSLTGGDAANYALDDDTISDTADILTKMLSATVTVADRTYDGTTAATITDCTLDGVVGTEDVTCDYSTTPATAAFGSASAGVDKPVSATRLLLDGTADLNNYDFDGTGTGTGTIQAFTLSSGDVVYTGQLEYYTESSSSTLARVTLTASITADFDDDSTETGPCTGPATVEDGRVQFIDVLSNRVIARDVRIAEVAEGMCEEGIATTFATLSSGQYGIEAYTIRVVVTGSLAGDNDGQADPEKTFFVQQPVQVNSQQGVGNIEWSAQTSTTDLGTAGSLTTDLTSGGGLAAVDKIVVYGFKVTYSSSSTKKAPTPKVQVSLLIPTTNGRYYVKATAVTSVTTSTVTGGKKMVLLAKGVIQRINDDDTVDAIDGGASFRLEAVDGGAGFYDSVAITVQSSKTSALYYSSHWAKINKAWLTIPKNVGIGTSSAVVIR